MKEYIISMLDEIRMKSRQAVSVYNEYLKYRDEKGESSLLTMRVYDALKAFYELARLQMVMIRHYDKAKWEVRVSAYQNAAFHDLLFRIVYKQAILSRKMKEYADQVLEVYKDLVCDLSDDLQKVLRVVADEEGGV